MYCNHPTYITLFLNYSNGLWKKVWVIVAVTIEMMFGVACVKINTMRVHILY